MALQTISRSLDHLNYIIKLIFVMVFKILLIAKSVLYEDKIAFHPNKFMLLKQRFQNR